MFYSIRHLTRFRYSAPVSESIMELRMQPRSEGLQRCLSFQVDSHAADACADLPRLFGQRRASFRRPERASAFDDRRRGHGGCGACSQLCRTAWSRTPGGNWTHNLASGDFWEMLTPSHFAQWTELMEQFAAELGVPAAERSAAARSVGIVTELNSAVYHAISYVPKSTRVDSPVDDASAKTGRASARIIRTSCWRWCGVWESLCRYVSGYLFHKAGDQVRSTEGATHAWVEAYLPGLGWVGFDPTNNIIAGESHVRTAVGRDYADVPPTRGVFKGDASSELTVAVRVAPSDKPPPPETEMESEDWSEVLHEDPAEIGSRGGGTAAAVEGTAPRSRFGIAWTRLQRPRGSLSSRRW